MTFEDILFEALLNSYTDRLRELPPPPPGYRYTYDYPSITHNGDFWDVTVDLCLEDEYGRKIRIKDHNE